MKLIDSACLSLASPALPRMALMALLSVSVPMQGLAQDTLETYTARYETSMYGMNLNIERKLVATDQGYRLSSEGKSFAATLSEVADFSVTDGQISGQHFVYQLKSMVRCTFYPKRDSSEA
jgi:hypothetical protein